MNKWLSRINKNNSNKYELGGDNVDDVSSNLTLATMSLTTKSVFHKKFELRKVITQVSQNYGGDDEKFLQEYINIILTGNIEKALECFRDLVNQTPSVNNRK